MIHLHEAIIIKAKFLAPTNTKGARISLNIEGGYKKQRKIIPFKYEFDFKYQIYKYLVDELFIIPNSMAGIDSDNITFVAYTGKNTSF